MSKTVSMGTILAVLLQTGVIVWWVTQREDHLDSRISAVEVIALRTSRHMEISEARQASRGAALARLDERLKAIQRTLAEIRQNMRDAGQ